MPAALAILFGAQLLGEAIVRGLAMPVPGPVMGMLLFLLGLFLARAVLKADPLVRTDPALGVVADGLLRHLSLLFVPAGTGIIVLFALIERHAFAIAAVLVLSTVLAMLTTVAVFRLVARRNAGDAQP
jgi:putative effector of murein hydrolase LrgA (UPF0299 family)